jgi:hypothetical protein
MRYHCADGEAHSGVRHCGRAGCRAVRQQRLAGAAAFHLPAGAIPGPTGAFHAECWWSMDWKAGGEGISPGEAELPLLLGGGWDGIRSGEKEGKGCSSLQGLHVSPAADGGGYVRSGQEKMGGGGNAQEPFDHLTWGIRTIGIRASGMRANERGLRIIRLWQAHASLLRQLHRMKTKCARR